MWSETRWSETRWSGSRAERAATGLDLEELVAMQPQRLRRALRPGQRRPGGERPGRGWAESRDFDGISPYQFGDDIRSIDWRATARSGRTQMRRFAASSHRARMVVVDLHPALFFGTRDRLMAKTAALVAALLCWESLALNEPVGLVLGGEPERPRRGKRHVLALLGALQQRYLAARDGEAGVQLPDLLWQASARLGRGDEICLVSDFGDPDPRLEEVSRALSGLRALRAYVVEDPLFRTPLPAGRYPMHGAGASQAVAIGRQAPEGLLQAIEDLRSARQGRLLDHGWEVVEALDLLPRHEERPA